MKYCNLFHSARESVTSEEDGANISDTTRKGAVANEKNVDPHTKVINFGVECLLSK